MVYWELCSKYGFEPDKHWYEHRAERVMKNKDTKTLRDFNIRTGYAIKARRPDIVVNDKNNQELFIIGVAYRVTCNEAEKISKYLDFALENILNEEYKNLTLLTEYLALIEVTTRKGDNMKQTAALGSAHILH